MCIQKKKNEKNTTQWCWLLINSLKIVKGKSSPAQQAGIKIPRIAQTFPMCCRHDDHMRINNYELYHLRRYSLQEAKKKNVSENKIIMGVFYVIDFN